MVRIFLFENQLDRRIELVPNIHLYRWVHSYQKHYRCNQQLGQPVEIDRRHRLLESSHLQHC